MFHFTEEQKVYRRQFAAVREAIRKTAEYQEYQARLEKMSKQEVRDLFFQAGWGGYSYKKWEMISQLLRDFVEKKAIAQGFPTRSLSEQNS